MAEKLDEINKGNLELYRSQSKSYQKSLNIIFFTCLKEIPREILIEGLKKKKIIKKDWNSKHENYLEYGENSYQETIEWITAFCKMHNLETLHQGVVKLIDCYKANTAMIGSIDINKVGKK